MATTDRAPVKLSNGAVLMIAAEPGASVDIEDAKERGLDLRKLTGAADFSQVANVIEGIAKDIVAALQEVKPNKTTVEFGLEVKAQSGGVLSLLAQGGATGDLKITLEWE